MNETLTLVNEITPITQLNGIPCICYDLMTLSHNSFGDLLEKKLKSFFVNRPFTILFEIDGTQFSDEVIKKGTSLFTDSGYTLTYCSNEHEGITLFKAIRNDLHAFGLQDIATDDFEAFKATESGSFLTNKTAYFNVYVSKKVEKLFSENSPFSKEEELDILDQFFN